MNWLNSVTRRLGVRTPSAPVVRPRLALEPLEAREVPAVALTWSGLGGNDLWSNPGNWDLGAAPQSADTVAFPANEFSIQDVPNLFVQRMTLSGGNTVLLQQPLALNGSGPGDQVAAGGATNAVVGGGGLVLIGSFPQVNVAAGSTLLFTTDVSGPSPLFKVGSGTLRLDKTASYQGDTHVQAGVLALNSSGVNQGLPNTSLLVGDGAGGPLTAEVRLLADNQIPNTAPIAIQGDGFLNLFGNSDTVADITLNGGDVGTGDGNLFLNGSVTATEDGSFLTGPAGGTLTLAAGDRAFTVAAGKTLTLFTKIAGSGGMLKDGAGTLTIDTSTNTLNNTYTGATTVKNGGLILDHDGFDAATSGTLVIGDGVGADKSAFVRLKQTHQLPNAIQITIRSDGLLDLNGESDGAAGLSLDGGADVTTGVGLLSLSGNVAVTSGITPAVISGNLGLGIADRTVTVADNPNGTDLVIDGMIFGGPNAGLIKDGAGTMEIKGVFGSPNTYGGTTHVKNGVLALNDTGSYETVSKTLVIGDGVGTAGSAVVRLLSGTQTPFDTAVTVRGDGRFDLNGFINVIGNLTLGDASGGGQVMTGTGTLIVSGTVSSKAAPTSSTISGKLNIGASPHTFDVQDGAAPNDLVIDAGISASPSAGIIKTGTGLLALDGANTYGPTAVNAGTLRVNGSQPNLPVSVAGGVFAGSGSVGAVTGSGGTVAPGVNAPGTLSTKNVTLGGITYAAELNGVAANQLDQIKVVGTVNLTGSTLAAALGFASSAGTSFRIIDNDGADAVVGLFNGLSEGATFPVGDRTFRITYQGGDGNDVVLTDVTPPGGGGGGGGSTAPQPYAVGTDVGGGPVAIVYNPDGSPKSTAQVFEAGFAGGVRTATGDVNGDGVADLIAGSGPGRVAEIRILDGVTGATVRSIQPFGDFTGGVFVAAGDFDNDGLTDVVITPDLSGGPRVTVVSGKDGAVLANFFGIDDAAFRGGARAAAGDVNGDGQDDLVISAGFGGGPRIAVFDGTSLGGTPTRLMSDFFAFEQTLRNGAYVAAGDLDGDGKDDLIFGGGPGGGPRVLALAAAKVAQGDMAGAELANFFAGNPDNRGGVRVVGKNLDGDGKADVVVGDGEKAGSRVTVYLGATIGTQGPPAEESFDAFPGFTGGVFVG